MVSVDHNHIVIIGGGIIGCTTAYYLSSHPKFSSATTQITLLEASKHGVAQGASGKAGGLVAKWAYPKELVKVSFAEHVRLAEKYNGKDKWGWRYVGCGSWSGRGDLSHFNDEEQQRGLKEKKSLEKTLGLGEDWKQKKNSRADTGLPDDLNWIREDLTDSYSSMAPNGHTAQVHPYLFTNSMLDLAKEQGVKYFFSSKATSIDVDQSNHSITDVTYVDSTTGETRTIPATQVIITAGAWSPSLIPQLPIRGTRAHSITIRPQPSVKISPYVLFTDISYPPKYHKRTGPGADPEIYARPDNEVYCCGPGDSSPLPDTVDNVEVNSDAIESLHGHVSSISNELKEGTVDKKQACFLPNVDSGGGPIVGEAHHIMKGLFIATGHTCWGICNAPGTAKALAELIFDGKISCANLKKLDPGQFL
ncbi:FAD dependent oxidoreductase [Abortiporus biennis]|nr:FAD dependent oxidoreductase [Abortiporus biennis]